MPIPIDFSSLIPKDVHLLHLLLDHVQFTLIHGSNIAGYYARLFFIASDFTFITRHIHSWASFLLWPSCFILSQAISSCPLLFPSSILDTFNLGTHLSVSYLLAFLYSPWGFLSKYTEVVCPCFLQWITFCQNSPLWPICLGGPCMPWLIPSLSYASPFTVTRQWSMKGI